jgi:hypothetical protein
MSSEATDFFRIPDEQWAIHVRLENWARCLTPRKRKPMAPMWRFTRSGSRAWRTPEPLRALNQKDADTIEHAVRTLPGQHRAALRWCYVSRDAPARIVRMLGITYSTLAMLVIDARSMLSFYLDRTKNGPVIFVTETRAADSITL